MYLQYAANNLSSNVSLTEFNARGNDIPVDSPSNEGNLALIVQAEQTAGTEGKITVAVSSPEFIIDESFYRSCSVRCVVMPDMEMPPNGRAGGMPPPNFGMSPPGGLGMPPPGIVDVTLQPGEQGLTGMFSVQTPGSYIVHVDLGNGQNMVSASKPIRFLLNKDAKPILIKSGEESTVPLADHFGWNGLNLTVQNVEVLSSFGEADISPSTSGKAVNSLFIRGIRAGSVDARATVIYSNGQTDEINITVDVLKGTFGDGIYEYIHSVTSSAKIKPVVSVVLLTTCLICFGFLLYRKFFERIPGSFVINCQCGATRFQIELKSPQGRSITLYQLLNKTLKQRTEDHEANIVYGTVNNNENKKNLRKIRIYVTKGSDGQSHYAFDKAGMDEIIDNTPRKVYPEHGNRNAQLTVHLSFIAQRKKRG